MHQLCDEMCLSVRKNIFLLNNIFEVVAKKIPVIKIGFHCHKHENFTTFEQTDIAT